MRDLPIIRGPYPHIKVATGVILKLHRSGRELLVLLCIKDCVESDGKTQ